MAQDLSSQDLSKYKVALKTELSKMKAKNTEKENMELQEMFKESRVRSKKMQV